MTKVTETGTNFAMIHNCLVRCENGVFTAVVGDFSLAEKFPDYSLDLHLSHRCQSLPCTPELGRTLAPLLRDPDLQSLGKDEEEEGGRVEDERRKEKGGMVEDERRKEKGGMVEDERRKEKGGMVRDERRKDEGGMVEDVSDDSGLLLDLDMVSLEEEEEEAFSLGEPMDCSRSPDTLEGAVPTPGRRLLHPASFSSSLFLQPNGWGYPVSNSPPPPFPHLPHLDNNNGSATVVVGRPIGWRDSSFRTAILDPPAGPAPEQDELISCPGCCLIGLSFPSLCLKEANGLAPLTAPCVPWLPLPEGQT
ncbi:uncharacterized protein LOC129841051 [Salvelinus fontinalis]|uniref:uncharacterized protein LOC129841051 n=1 Tax=Salvelinus fontinalis TaxID=8038 RepID=UPI0024855B9A|nr:uncharacterized protein LOC129841051 [Salvelinus fontinalis]